MPKKKFKWVKWVVIAALLGAAAFAGYKFLGGKGTATKTAATEFVNYGSISSTVEGSGLAKAKNSETLMLSTAGTVLDVYVEEGQTVEAGDPLFVIESKAAEAAVQTAENNLEGYQKQLNTALKDLSGLQLAPSYSGKLMDTVRLYPGDEIHKGAKIATLIDDTQMRLTQYYSYAYEGDFRTGMKMQVSIPSLMSSVEGTVEEVRMVSRITKEGSKLFCVTVLIPNEGVLTAGMQASAVSVNAQGESIYPYEPSELEYYRTGDLCSTVAGTVISAQLYDYQDVKAGQVLVQINGDKSDAEIFELQQRIETAEKELEIAEKNLANCQAVAPISGKIIGLSMRIGDEIPANTALATISDTQTIIVNASVDERNISYIKPGTFVNLDQWGNTTFGVIESVSLNSTISNGVATYPIVISAENPTGNIQVNSYINYNLVASQADNCLVVPLQAVRIGTLEDGSEANILYVKSDFPPENMAVLAYDPEEIPDGFYPVVVETGISDNYYIEIKSGVEEGTEVFTVMIQSEYWG